MLRERSRWVKENAVVSCLLSAVFWGGLLEKAALDELLKSINEPLLSGRSGSWIDLRLYQNTPVKSRIRRFWFDEITESLWLSIHANDSPIGSASELIENALSELHHGQVVGIDLFLKAVACEYSTQLPEVITHYATGQTITHPVMTDRWQAIEGISIPIDGALVETEEPKADDFNDKEKDVESDPLIKQIHIQGLDRLREAIRHKNLKDMRRLLREIGQGNSRDPSIIVWLARWLSDHRLKARASTRRWMFGLIGPRLASICGKEDFFVLDDDELEDRFNSVISDGNSPRHRAGMRYALRKFHRYVFSDGSKKESIILREMEHIEVSARLITHDEYEQVLERLGRPSPTHNNPEWLLICQLLFILYFRLGLRRRELMFLPLHDIHGKHVIEILIRPYHERELKTANALRKLQVNGFLSEKEFEMLTQWLNKRREQEKSNPQSNKLFSLVDEKNKKVSEEGVVGRIVKMVREVTGDGDFHLHHLRHSFATWSAMSLIGEAADISYEFLGKYPATQAWVKKFHNVMDEKYIGEPEHRGRIFQLSVLMGHSNPAITMEHYIHCMDILLRGSIDSVYTVDKKVISGAAIHEASRTLQRWSSKGKGEQRNRLISSNQDRAIIWSDENNDDVGSLETIFDRLYGAWEAIKSIDDEKKIDNENRIISRYSNEDVNKWMHNIIKLQEAKVLKHGYPSLGGGGIAIKKIKAILERLSNIKSVADPMELLAEASCLWLKYKVPSRAAARFKDCSEATGYINKLLGLGFSWGELKLSWVGSRFIGKEEKRCKSDWRMKLGISKRIKIHTVSLSNNRPLSKNCGYFDVAISESRDSKRASIEAQWCLVMSFIILSEY